MATPIIVNPTQPSQVVVNGTQKSGTPIKVTTDLDYARVQSMIDEAVGDVNIDTTDLAKQGDNPEATNSKIYDAVKGIPDLSLLYAARAEKNDDGVNTYSIVLPVTAKVTYDDNGVATIQL